MAHKDIKYSLKLMRKAKKELYDRYYNSDMSRETYRALNKDLNRAIEHYKKQLRGET